MKTTTSKRTKDGVTFGYDINHAEVWVALVKAGGAESDEFSRLVGGADETFVNRSGGKSTWRDMIGTDAVTGTEWFLANLSNVAVSRYRITDADRKNGAELADTIKASPELAENVQGVYGFEYKDDADYLAAQFMKIRAAKAEAVKAAEAAESAKKRALLGG